MPPHVAAFLLPGEGLVLGPPRSVSDAGAALSTHARKGAPRFRGYRQTPESPHAAGTLKTSQQRPLFSQTPRVLRSGTDCTLVASSFSTQLCLDAAQQLATQGIDCEVIDLRVINPIDYSAIIASVQKTGRLCAVDGGWKTCGLAGEVIAGVTESIAPSVLKSSPKRLTLPDAPAPTSKVLEEMYYLKSDDIAIAVSKMMKE